MWSSFEDSFFLVMQAIFPDLPIIFAYQNGPENVTPYCYIDTLFAEPIGREETGYDLGNILGGASETKEVYSIKLRVNFVGKDAVDNHGGNLCHTLSTALVTPEILALLEVNNMSLFQKGQIKKIPKLRETTWYNSYVIDLVLAYQITTVATASPVDAITVEATYTLSADGPDITDSIIIP